MVGKKLIWPLFLTHLGFIAGGWTSGICLDGIVFELSYDYVFPPGMFRKSGIQAGWLVAAIVGSILVFRAGDNSSTPNRWIAGCTVIAVFIGLIVTLLTPLLLVGLRELGLFGPVDLLQTGRRHFYCMTIAPCGIAGSLAAITSWSSLSKRRSVIFPEHTESKRTNPAAASSEDRG